MSKSILIVEDEETLRESIKRIFTKEGYAVDAAESAEKGFALLETSVYDVIISDIVMPRLSGFELFKRVKAQPATASIPFLFITGFQDDRVLAEARKVGVFGILRKPVDIEQIESRLRSLTGSRE